MGDGDGPQTLQEVSTYYYLIITRWEKEDNFKEFINENLFFLLKSVFIKSLLWFVGGILFNFVSNKNFWLNAAHSEWKACLNDTPNSIF